jgi:hypothetical protein
MTTTAALLVLAAFILSAIAVTVSVLRRHEASIVEKQGAQSADQPNATMDVMQTFEAAVAASQAARRARLSRRERIRRIGIFVAFGLSGVVVILALAAVFLIGDRKAAVMCAMMAAISLNYTTMAFLSTKRAR